MLVCVVQFEAIYTSLSIRHSVSWTPSQAGRKEGKRFDPRQSVWGRGSWSMSAPLRLHFPSVSFLFFPQCQAQTLKTSTLIGPSQWELLFRLSNCDPRCQPVLTLTECLQTNSTMVFPSPALDYSSVTPPSSLLSSLPGLSISLHHLYPGSPAWFHLIEHLATVGWLTATRQLNCPHFPI